MGRAVPIETVLRNLPSEPVHDKPFPEIGNSRSVGVSADNDRGTMNYKVVDAVSIGIDAIIAVDRHRNVARPRHWRSRIYRDLINLD